MIKPHEFVEALRDWTTLDILDAIHLLEDTYGIKAVVPVQQLPSTTQMVEEVEEQSEFKLTLVGIADGTQKINVIKVVREVTGLGLKESKEAVDNIPTVLFPAVEKAKADELTAKLVAQGAIIKVE